MATSFARFPAGFHGSCLTCEGITRIACPFWDVPALFIFTYANRSVSQFTCILLSGEEFLFYYMSSLFVEFFFFFFFLSGQNPWKLVRRFTFATFKLVMHALFLETTIVRSLSNQEGICQTGRNRLTIALEIKDSVSNSANLISPFLSSRGDIYILQHARNEITLRWGSTLYARQCSKVGFRNSTTASRSKRELIVTFLEISRNNTPTPTATKRLKKKFLTLD